MIKISLQNAGGELDSAEVATPSRAAEAVVSMVQSAGELYPGDKIVITGDEETPTK